jgi:hypothetical protein
LPLNLKTREISWQIDINIILFSKA